jgi:hypothetical protein
MGSDAQEHSARLDRVRLRAPSREERRLPDCCRSARRGGCRHQGARQWGRLDAGGHGSRQRPDAGDAAPTRRALTVRRTRVVAPP